MGLRGQAKEIGSQDDQLLDEYIPFVTGSEINDDPCNPFLVLRISLRPKAMKLNIMVAW
jgi:hypothetical protein